jgi:hypothetical protein
VLIEWKCAHCGDSNQVTVEDHGSSMDEIVTLCLSDHLGQRPECRIGCNQITMSEVFSIKPEFELYLVELQNCSLEESNFIH